MLLNSPGGKAIFTIVSACALLISCASPKPLTGGAKDETPPAIVQEESTPNHQTHFNEKEIVIQFDEWINLKDVYTQLVISPLMPEEPEIKQKGKGIIISLPDSLNEETTYTINFGNAISDLNEGNVLENYSFVFSTGSVLDSIRLSGTVIDAVSLKPAEGVWVMLHPVGDDSVVYQRKPEYLSKTNKSGAWSIANIRSDSFQVMALKDENVNFLYDQETELFGWLDKNIYTDEPVAILPEITVFPKEKRSAMRDLLHETPGWIKIIVDGPIINEGPVLSPAMDSTMTEWSGDTLHIWYSNDKNYSGYAIYNGDSILIRKSAGILKQTPPLELKPLTGRLHPAGIAQFGTVIPLSSIDTSRVQLSHDSLGVVPFQILLYDSLNRQFGLQAAWIPPSRYTITFFPGAITDFWGRVNDTLRYSIVINSEDQFGDLTLNIEGLDSTRSYLVRVKSGEQILEQFVVENLTTAQVKKTQMPPGKYVAEIIEDTNRNQKWDTGDYSKRRQPERRMNFTLDNLRAGWELDVKLLWK